MCISCVNCGKITAQDHKFSRCQRVQHPHIWKTLSAGLLRSWPSGRALILDSYCQPSHPRRGFLHFTDLRGRRLVSNTGTSFPATLTAAPAVCGLRTPTDGPFESILEEFRELLVQNVHDKVKHKVKHYIKTSGPPLHAGPRRLEGEGGIPQDGGNGGHPPFGFPLGIPSLPNF